MGSYLGTWILLLMRKRKWKVNPIDINITKTINNTFNESWLNDSGFKGNMETWCNNQDDAHFISAMMDKYMVNKDGNNLSPLSNNTHLPWQTLYNWISFQYYE